MERTRRTFRDVWHDIVQEAEREGPEAIEQLEDFRSAFTWARELALARKSKNLSQSEVAKRTGIDQAEISKIESGAANPTVQTLSRLVAAYDMRVGLVPAQVAKSTGRTYVARVPAFHHYVVGAAAVHGRRAGSSLPPSKAKKGHKVMKARRKGSAGG
jgi:DNA-binding phage protein